MYHRYLCFNFILDPSRYEFDLSTSPIHLLYSSAHKGACLYYLPLYFMFGFLCLPLVLLITVIFVSSWQDDKNITLLQPNLSIYIMLGK